MTTWPVMSLKLTGDCRPTRPTSLRGRQLKPWWETTEARQGRAGRNPLAATIPMNATTAWTFQAAAEQAETRLWLGHLLKPLRDAPRARHGGAASMAAWSAARLGLAGRISATSRFRSRGSFDSLALAGPSLTCHGVCSHGLNAQPLARTKLLDAPVQIPLGAPLRNPFGAPLNLVDDLVAPFDRLLVPLRRSWTHPPNSGDCRDRPRSGRGGYRADSPSRARDRAPRRQARPGLVQYLSGSSSLPISSYGDAPGRVGAVPSRRIRP